MLSGNRNGYVIPKGGVTLLMRGGKRGGGGG